MKTLNGIFLSFFQIEVSCAPHTSELYRKTGANKASKKKLHLDIRSLLNSMSFTSKEVLFGGGEAPIRIECC